MRRGSEEVAVAAVVASDVGGGSRWGEQRKGRDPERVRERRGGGLRGVAGGDQGDEGVARQAGRSWRGSPARRARSCFGARGGRRRRGCSGGLGRPAAVLGRLVAPGR